MNYKMNYKVKHKYTGLYYQPTTASGSNMEQVQIEDLCGNLVPKKI
jgi:hypothetical protein